MILAFVGSEVAIGAIAPVCAELYARTQEIKIVLYGAERFKLKSKIPFFLQVITVLHEDLKSSDFSRCCAVLITDLPKPNIPHATIYAINHGSIPSRYNERLWAVSDVYFGQFAAEERQLRSSVSDAKKSFVVTGSPKQELGPFQQTSKTAQLGQTPASSPLDNRTLAVISHWSHRGLIRTFGISILEMLQELSARQKFNLVVHVHPKLVDATQKDRYFDRASVDFTLSAAKHMGIQLSSGADMGFLANTDIIVGDCTSIMAQASLLESDIICYRPDQIPIAEFDEDFRAMLYEFSSLDHLAGSISFCLQNPNSKRKLKNKFATKYILNTTNSARSIASTILDRVFE